MNEEGKVKMCQQIAKLVKLKVGERVKNATPIECRVQDEAIPLNYEGNTVQKETTKIQLNEAEEEMAEIQVTATEDETAEIQGTVAEDETTHIHVTEAEEETAEIQVNEDEATSVDPSLTEWCHPMETSNRKRKPPVKLSKDFL
jgi:hypothetical protein